MKNIINNLKLILIIIIWLFTLKYIFNVFYIHVQFMILKINNNFMFITGKDVAWCCTLYRINDSSILYYM